MSVTRSIAMALAVSLAGPAAFAGEVQLYPYSSKENFCPSGLQPISLNGVICCGRPTADQSYQSVMAHPVRQRVQTVRRSKPARQTNTCQEGEKGCY